MDWRRKVSRLLAHLRNTRLYGRYAVLAQVSGDRLIAPLQPGPGSRPFNASPAPWLSQPCNRHRSAPSARCDWVTSTACVYRLVGGWGTSCTHTVLQIFCVRLERFWQEDRTLGIMSHERAFFLVMKGVKGFSLFALLGTLLRLCTWSR